MGQDIPEAKQTVLGLYVTSAEAYEKCRAAPDKVALIDVRTPEEFIYVGHPEMAVCIPLGYQSYRWDEQKGYYDLDVNAEFVAQVQERFDPGDTLLMMCRSGGRSAMAANLLARAGYTDAWNIVDGMEGELVNDPESPHHGKRMQDGWKNADLPWTYEVDPERVRLPDTEGA